MNLLYGVGPGVNLGSARSGAGLLAASAALAATDSKYYFIHYLSLISKGIFYKSDSVHGFRVYKVQHNVIRLVSGNLEKHEIVIPENYMYFFFISQC